MQIFAVRYETRDYIGRIVEEIDSLWLDRDKAYARRDEINTDLVKYENTVAFTFRYTIQPRTRSTNPRLPKNLVKGRKLTQELAMEISERFDAGEAARPLAIEYKISYQTVYDIVNRKHWGHI